MMLTVQSRVARGAAWLDVRYPGWYKAIDLGVLDISDCYSCVLGQVYTGAIPAGERGQILAQVIKSYADASAKPIDYWENSISLWGGYSILNDFHELEGAGLPYGFLALRDDLEQGDSQALLDEWTQVIIERRVADHPDLVGLTCRLDDLRIPATVA